MLVGQVLAFTHAIQVSIKKQPIISLYDQNLFKGNKAVVTVGFTTIIIGSIVLFL
jgi:hypothetical protein